MLNVLALAVEEVIEKRTARAPGLEATVPACLAVALAPSGALRLEDFADHAGQIGGSSVKRIRKALSGNGNASKQQIRETVAHILKISPEGLPLDASDALALSLGYAQMQRLTLRSEAGVA